MIDEYYTWIFYGYHSDELSKGSHKQVVAMCDDCSKYRTVEKKAYRDLCKSCAGKYRTHSEETKHKMSGRTAWNKGLKDSEDTRKRKSMVLIRNHRYKGCTQNLSPEVRLQRSKSMIGNKYSEGRTSSKFSISNETLKDEYEAGSTTPYLAGKYGCTHFTILRRLRLVGCEIRPKGGHNKLYFSVSNDDLKNEYENGSTTYQLAEKYNTSQPVIWDRLRRVGCKMRKPHPPKIDVDPIVLKKLYISEIPIKELAKKYGCSTGTIGNRLKSVGVILPSGKFDLAHSSEISERMTINNPMQDMTTRHKVSATAQGIPYDEWKEYATKQKYCYKFNNQLKTKIRSNYNNCDYISGIHKDICNNGRNLDVHHVDYNKQQGCEDHQWKLIPLSKSNHAKTNTNRSFWNRLFIYSLQYEKEYYGDE